MSKQQAPILCSLFGLLATEAPRAVILRRGPTRRVQLLLWHTDTDTFEEGQWFYGRIYEWGCDLSPDGMLFLYLAQKAKTHDGKSQENTYKLSAQNNSTCSNWRGGIPQNPAVLHPITCP